MTDLQTPPVPHSPELTEHDELVHRLSRLRADLESTRRENARLEHQLRTARAENRRLREQLGGLPTLRARQERRRILSAPWSRNP